MKTIRKNASLRYLEFIKDLKNIIELNEDISISNLTDKHRIARGQLKNLNGLKIIKQISPRRFKWIGNMPTLKMAKEILEFQKNIEKNRRQYLNIQWEQKQIDFKSPVIKKIKKEVLPTEVKAQNKNYSFSLFWGLIKINKS